MIDKYEGLLINLGISPDGNSFEISRLLKEKKNERKSMMTSRQSREENRRLEEEIHAINEAEIYFEKLAQEEKKEDKLDGFDYSSLQNKGRKRRRAKMVVSVQADDVQEDELSFEERYDNIIGFMGTPDGFDDGLKQLEQLAEDGYVVAQRRVGDMYFEGEKGIDVNWQTAAYWYEKAANQGDAQSQNSMGIFFANTNEYFPRDREQAIKWFKMAAEQDLPVACWNTAYSFDGLFELIDKNEAFNWYKRAAELGYIEAFNELGRYYYEGWGTEKNIPEAIKWYEEAAEEGNVNAYWNLGLVYEEVKNDERAFYWYKKAAESGFANAYNNVGIYYKNGYGVEKNVEEAIKWYEKAAEQGNVNAYWNLGLVYEYEEVKNNEIAFYWYKKAAESGMAKACNKVGIYYENGRGVEKNVEEAIKWYEKATEQGNVDAYWNLGIVYQYEEVKNDEKAFYWYKRAAESGTAKACNKVGIYYQNGRGTEKNVEEAIKWYEKAAEQGNTDAYWNLGHIYELKAANDDFGDAFNGMFDELFGGPASEENYIQKSAYWYQKSAESGDGEGMYKLGKIYENNFHNDYEAAQWYLKAIQAGYQDAQIAFDRLSGK